MNSFTPRRPRASRRIVLVLACAVAGVCVAGDSSVAVAQDPATKIEVPKFDRTPAEDEVYTLYVEGKLLTARRKAEALLEADPDSIVGNYVFGCVLREAEGQLPQAMRHLGRARELYEGRWNAGAGEGPTQLHREIIYAIQGLAGELEKHEYQLQMQDWYDSLYSPRLVAEHAWPLMRLGRFDEAREVATKAANAVDPAQRSLGRNALCAIEAEAASRGPRFEACRLAFEGAEKRAQLDPPHASPAERTAVAVHAYNASLAARAMLRPDEAERLAIAGTKKLDFTPANPWRLLTAVYVDQGRMNDAINALREMQRWRQRQPPYLRDQDRAETDATFAMAMLVAAETERGLEAIERAIARPDRRGLTSSGHETVLGAHALLRRALIRTHAEAQREAASWHGTVPGVTKRMEAAWASATTWTDAQRIATVLADDERLVKTFQLYVSGGLEPVPVWLLGDLVDVLGPGIVDATLMEVRRREQERPDSIYPQLEPYYDAVQAEVALARGETDVTLHLVRKAMPALPVQERLLRARVAAVGAKAALREGDEKAAGEFLTAVMDADAGVIRRMGLALPTSIENRGTGASAQAVEKLLRRSPRLRDGDVFKITIDGDRDTLTLCLSNALGAQLACATPVVEVPEEDLPRLNDPTRAEVEAAAKAKLAAETNDDTWSRLAAEAFHDRAFAMPVGLSNIDFRSLDGRATVSEEAARASMQDALEKAMKEAR